MKAFEEKLSITVNNEKLRFKITKKFIMLQRLEKIKEYLAKGYSQRRIAYLLKIPQPTVYYTLKQFRSGFYD